MLPDQFVTVVPPQMAGGSQQAFRGTADAVYQSLRLVKLYRPNLVAVFGADHIYRMDVRQMILFHREHRADVTVSALPVPVQEASGFGVIATEADGRIVEFQEKPAQPKPMPGDPTRAYASMGNYIFNADVLVQALMQAHERGETDFGHHVLPRLLETRRLYAYDFATNEIPGLHDYEERGYWRDVGSIDAYFESHKDVIGDDPCFDAFDPQWPIYSSNYQGPVARILGGEIDNCLFGAATIVCRGAHVRNSIIRRESVIEVGAELEDCIVMDYSRIGAGSKLRRVIVDRHNRIEPGSVIGYDLDADRARYHVSEGGVVVVPRGDVCYYARNTRGQGPGYME